MRAALPALLALVLLPATAVALDVLLTHARMDDTEARVLVRLPAGGRLLVEGPPGVEAALAEPEGAPGAYAPLPTALLVVARAPEESWHGLPGTVEVALRRADPSRSALVTIRGEDGVGTEVEWPATTRDVPLPSPLALAAAGVIALLMAGRRRGSGSR